MVPPMLIARADEVIEMGWSDVRLWHKADILVALSNVCFRG
jgi:hypothetical protein